MSTVVQTVNESGGPLPKGWRWGTVNETGRYINGVAFKPTDWGKEGIPIIRIQNLTNPDKPLNRTTRQVDPVYQIEPGDMMVSWSATLDAFIWDREPAILNQHIFKVVPDEKVAHKRFLFYLLKLAITEMIKSEHLHGSTMKHINRGPFLAHRVPLPPLLEQLRIVAEIDKQFTRLDAGVAALRRVQANLKRYRAAVLKAACEGQLVLTEAELHQSAGKGQKGFEPGEELLKRILTERRERWTGRDQYKEPATPDTSNLPPLPAGWKWVGMRQVAEVQLGRQRAPQHHSGDNMRPYLRVANVFEARIDTSDVMWMNFTPVEFEKYRLCYGDILLNEGQTPELVGRPAMYRDEVPDCCYQKTLLRFRAYKGLLPQFALTVFRAYMHNRRFTRAASITTNIAHLTAEKFVEIEFPLPPLAEQTRIVAEVERRLSVVEELESVVAANLQRATRLRQSILQKAFTGKLTS